MLLPAKVMKGVVKAAMEGAMLHTQRTATADAERRRRSLLSSKAPFRHTMTKSPTVGASLVHPPASWGNSAFCTKANNGQLPRDTLNLERLKTESPGTVPYFVTLSDGSGLRPCDSLYEMLDDCLASGTHLPMHPTYLAPE